MTSRYVIKKTVDGQRLIPHSCAEDYTAQYPWPDNCFVQCGGWEKKGYFIEAFPKNPNTFIRSNGKSLEEAENKAWNQLQKYNVCELDHNNSENFERRDYKNGAGFCKACGMFRSKIFEPATKCCKCGTSTNWTTDKNGDHWCKKCYKDIPKDLIPEWKLDIDIEEIEKSMKSMSTEEFNSALTDVIARISKAARGNNEA